jgi:hypothetical protein
MRTTVINFPGLEVNGETAFTKGFPPNAEINRIIVRQRTEAALDFAFKAWSSARGLLGGAAPTSDQIHGEATRVTKWLYSEPSDEDTSLGSEDGTTMQMIDHTPEWGFIPYRDQDCLMNAQSGQIYFTIAAGIGQEATFDVSFVITTGRIG